jgi:Xaa-Pro aminopeptidase
MTSWHTDHDPVSNKITEAAQLVFQLCNRRIGTIFPVIIINIFHYISIKFLFCPDQGLDPALPGGANKTPLKEGQSVMVDLGGNFNGYMNDMSRVFSIGKLPEEAYTAHQVCLDIQEKIASIARPGIACEVLYDTAVEVVKAAGFADKFMGTGQQAKFIGHGIGLEINEAPVLAPRIKQQLEPGMVFALEPKIVIPGVGPVGIENSWVVTNEGIEKLTNCNEEIIELS